MNLKQKAHGIVFQETKKKTIIKPKHCSICKTDRHGVKFADIVQKT